MKQILTGLLVVLTMGLAIAQNDSISYINVSADITNETVFGAQDGAIDIEITNAVEPLQVIWSNGATTEDIDQLSAGLYILTVIDANQESGIFPFEVNLDFNPSDTITDTECDGFYGETVITPPALGLIAGMIDLTVYGGVEPYTYLWSTGATTEDINDVWGGDYSVFVYDANGCAFTINEYVEYLDPDSILNDSINNFPCFGFYALSEVTPIIQEENGSIDVTVFGGTEPYEFLWSNGETTEDIANLEEGPYTLEISDAEGCYYSIQEYVYNIGNDSIPNDTIIDDPCFGLYGFTYATPIQQLYGSIDLTVFGGLEPYTYEWSNGAITQDIFELEEGMYSVVVNDANGCSFTLEDYVIDFNNDTTFNDTIFDFPCFGFFAMGYPTYTSVEGAADGAIDLEVYGGTAPYNYTWSNDETTEDISGLEEGFYSVIVEDAEGCETSYMEYIYTSYLDSNVWDFPIDSFDVVDPIDSCFQITINSAEINAYEFIDDSVFVTWNVIGDNQELLATFILSYFAELDEAGVYQFEISFVPCDSRASNTVNSFVDHIYIDPAIITSVSNPNVNIDSHFEIYPNPVTDFVNVKLDANTSSNLTVEIISINGQVVQTENRTLNSGSNTLQINSIGLQKGIYLLKLTDANGEVNVKRFVK